MVGLKLALLLEYLNTTITSEHNVEEGESTTDSNIAAVISEERKNGLLVETYMCKPTTQHTFKLRKTHALSSVLMGQCEVEVAIQFTDLENIYVLLSEQLHNNQMSY